MNAACFILLGILILMLCALWIYFSMLYRNQNVIITPYVTELSTIPTNYTIRIVTPRSQGPYYDALLYQKVLSNSEIYFTDACDKIVKDITIYLSLNDINISSFPTTTTWLMVNQELLDESQFKFLKNIDVFLCKSLYSYNIMVEQFNKYKSAVFKSTCNIIYTRHSSMDFGKIIHNNILISNDSSVGDRTCYNDIEQMVDHKNYKQFIHFAGSNPYKNTNLIINTWIKNGGFPDLNYPELIVTCKLDCLNSCSMLFTEFIKTDVPGKYIHPKIPNMILYTHISQNKLVKYMSSGGFFIMPSMCEGYGHSINEARSVCGTIITTDHAPMNELINENSGFLIQPRATAPCDNLLFGKTIDGSNYAIIDEDDIKNIIYKACLTPIDRLKEMGVASRRLYEADTKYFFDTMDKFINNKK